MSSNPTFRQWASLARLRRTGYLLCGDWHLAEDSTQDTLIRIHAVWGRISASGSPDGYATRVLVNSYRTQLRRPWRRESPVPDVPDTIDPGTVPPAGHDDKLMVALAQLGFSQRAVVVLRYWQGRSIAEVADILNLSTGTVKSQAARGLARLRTLLGETEPPTSSEDAHAVDGRAALANTMNGDLT